MFSRSLLVLVQKALSKHSLALFAEWKTCGVKMWCRLLVCVCVIQNVRGFLYPLIFPEKVYNYTPPEDEVTFHLYHRSDFSISDQIFIGDTSSVKRSRYDPYLPLKIIIHGWTHGKDVPWLTEMREVMASTGMWNVLVTDWAPLSHYIYVETRIHAYVVGKQLKRLLMFLRESREVSLKEVHLIGHSMGAQISAMAGQRVYEESGEKVGRITGLDPAAPFFEWPHMESMDDLLDPTDADFVDVIHTNARHLGMMTPAGHVDYYPDGGELQDDCNKWSCSHMRSCELWIASVLKPDLFRAFSYKSWNEFLRGKTDHLDAFPMGIAAGPWIPEGIYFVEKTDEWRKYVTTKTTLADSFS